MSFCSQNVNVFFFLTLVIFTSTQILFHCRIQILTLKCLNFLTQHQLVKLSAEFLSRVLLRSAVCNLHYHWIVRLENVLIIYNITWNYWQDPIETEKNFARRILGIVVCLHNPSFSFHIVGHSISFQSVHAKSRWLFWDLHLIGNKDSLVTSNSMFSFIFCFVSKSGILFYP
jgi:hypothetical protein